MKKFILFCIFAFLITCLSSCEGGISGSVMGSRQKCSSDIAGGHCEGSFKKLSGTISEDMSMTRTGFQTVKAEVWASVEEGALRVYLVDPEGVKTSQVVYPGQPATLVGEAEAYYDSFRVYFEALDGDAQGVEYVIDYTYP